MTHAHDSRTLAVSVWCVAALALAAFSGGAAEKDTPEIDAQWGTGYRSLTFDFRGQKCEYPQDMRKSGFPATGQAPELRFEKDWPVVAMCARWTISVDGWPEQYRQQAVDLILGNVEHSHRRFEIEVLVDHLLGVLKRRSRRLGRAICTTAPQHQATKREYRQYGHPTTDFTQFTVHLRLLLPSCHFCAARCPEVTSSKVRVPGVGVTMHRPPKTTWGP